MDVFLRFRPVFLKVGEIVPSGAILICKGAKKTKGAKILNYQMESNGPLS